MKKLLLILVLLSPSLSFGACPATGWCNILNGNTSMPPNGGWNQLEFSHDTGLFYLYSNNTAVLGNPFQNTFWTYKVQGNTYTSYTSCDGGQPCLSQLSSCGDSTGNTTGQSPMCLVTAMDASTVPATIQMVINGNDTISWSQGIKPSTSPNGLLYFTLDDEVISVSACAATSGGSGGDCPQNSVGPFTFTVAARNLRTGAGAVESAHNGGGTTANCTPPISGASPAHFWFACTAPSYNGGAADVTKDMPASRHPISNYYYRPSTGELRLSFGYDENSGSYRDMWSDCIFQTSFCTTAKIAAGWQRIPQSLQNVPGNTQYQGTSMVAQNAGVYDSDDDVEYTFGGTNTGNASDNTLWVHCLTANALVYVDATHNCGSTGYVGLWHMVTPASGSVPGNEAPRGDYDPVNHLVVYFGGCNPSDCSPTGVKYNVAFVWMPHAGNWCSSDIAQWGTNGSSCPSQFASAHYPGAGQPLKANFPAWTFDSGITPEQFVYLTNDNPSQVWLYNAGTNTWTVTGIGGGPALSSLTFNSGQSLGHDDVNHQLVWITSSGSGLNSQIWQLPDATISGAPSNPIGQLTPTSLAFGNQFVNTTSAAQTSTLTNGGTAALTITSIGISGTNAAEFSQTNNCPISPSTLAVNASCTISVKFSPTTAAAKSAQVDVNDNSGGSSVDQTISLSGTGVTPTAVPTTLDRGLTLER